MTEAEWLTGWDYRRMYGVVRAQATTRQLRLFMAACGRLMSDWFFDDRILRAIEAAEFCADDPTLEALTGIDDERFGDLPSSPVPRTGFEEEFVRRVREAWQLFQEQWIGMEHRTVEVSILEAVCLGIRSQPREVYPGISGDAAEECAMAIDTASRILSGFAPWEVYQDELEGETEIRQAIAHLLRDVFGNPFRPVPLNPTWRTPLVHAIAQTAYEERAFDTMPILADALEDAGCLEEPLLSHLRGQYPHARGCWALDLILGTE